MSSLWRILAFDLTGLRQIFPGSAVLRIEAEDGFKFGSRFSETASFGESHAKIEMSIDKFRLKSNDFLELSDGVAGPVLSAVSEAKIVSRFGDCSIGAH